MKQILITIAIAIVFVFIVLPARYYMNEKQNQTITVYTPKNIYYIDAYNLTVASEDNEEVKTFHSYTALNTYIENITADDVNKAYFECNN